VREILSLREPKSLAICTLLDKPDRREVQVPVEFVGFSIPDEFVVGYGIDYAQRYRHLPYVGKVVCWTSNSLVWRCAHPAYMGKCRPGKAQPPPGFALIYGLRA
jgi:hypothetical protein